jgi:hypothetical protein
MHWFELLGYVGSIGIAASLMMRNILRLRLLNMAGAILFAGYGIMIGALPVILLNVFNAAINLYQVVHLLRKPGERFILLPLSDVNASYLELFLNYHRADIEAHFPGFRWDQLKNPQGHFVLRNLIPTGLFVYETCDRHGAVNIKLDYVTPDYRDFKNARFVYHEQRELLLARGFTMYQTRSDVPTHRHYLEKLGFVKDAADPSLFRLQI